MTDSEQLQRARSFRVGLLTLTALVVFGFVVTSIGTTQGLFSRKARFATHFKNIGGLSEGAPVKLSGVPVGAVAEITFAQDLSLSDIQIVLTVDRRHAARIREGTTAFLKSLSLLSGEKYIELSPGLPERPALPPGSTIPPSEPGGDLSELGGAATDVAAEVVKIADNLNKILVSINTGDGLLGRMVTDPDFGKPTLEALQHSLEQIRDIIGEIREGRSTAGRLLVDGEYGTRITDELQGSISSLRSILDKVDRGDGTAALLVNDPKSGKAILDNLVEATDTLKGMLDEIKQGQGLAAKLIYDKEYGEAVSKDLAEAVKNVRSITEKIDRGEGSIGKVVNDPGLYASLHDVVSGVQKSKIIGWAIRHYQKKGVKARAKDAVEELGDEQALESLEETYGEELGSPGPPEDPPAPS